MLRRLGRRLEDLRQLFDLREFNHSHGTTAAVHEIQSKVRWSVQRAQKSNSSSFQFRVALLLSENEAIYSEPSVVISTNEEGVPESPPIIEQIGAVDQTRIMVSWKSGLKNNGPILSYKLEIRDLTQPGYIAVKVDLSENFKALFDFQALSDFQALLPSKLLQESQICMTKIMKHVKLSVVTLTIFSMLHDKTSHFSNRFLECTKTPPQC